VAGIDVKLHATFFLILVLYGWMYYTAGGMAHAVAGVAFVSLLFFCVLLHEFGHALAARAFGIRTPDITLLPIGGVARLERMPTSPWQEFLIAIAGPAVNVGIAIILLPFALGSFGTGDFESVDSAEGGLLGKLLAVNIMLVAFNLIPAFPMDGGRILRSLLATTMKHSKATFIAARVGQFIAVLFAVAGFFGNPMLIFIALFVFMGAQQELAASQFLEAVGSRRVSDAMLTRFEMLPAGLDSRRAQEMASSNGQIVFPVVDSALRVMGLVSREDLVSMGAGAPLRQVPVVSPDLPARSALELMRGAREPILPVVNSSGQVVGLVSAAALTKF
jgi:Zn-dependent protease